MEHLLRLANLDLDDIRYSGCILKVTYIWTCKNK